MRNQYVVGLGELLWDLLPDGKKIGGAPCNFAYHASQFGFQSAIVSAVGCDALGDEILDNIAAKAVGGVVERVDFPTGVVQVTLDGNGVPIYEIKESVAWDNIQFTDAVKQLAENTMAVVFGSLAQRSEVSRNTIAHFLETMSDEEGHYKIFDINLRQEFYSKAIIESSMQRCNILKINDEELVAIGNLFGCSVADQQEMCWSLLERYNLKLLILTCGVDGSYVFTPGSVSFVATPKVEVADTVGAGDSFTATFISSLLRGESVKESHKRAVRASAFVCTQHGAMPIIPEDLKL